MYILRCARQEHFFGAEVFPDGAACLFLSHKRHVTLELSPQNVARVARNWSVFRVEQTSGHVQGKESVDVDALGGAAALELASVVPTVEMNCPVPFAELCHLRQCCRDLRTCMGDWKERFNAKSYSVNCAKRSTGT